MHTFKTSKSKENILSRIRKDLNKQSLPIPYPEIEQQQHKEIYSNSDASAEETFAANFNKLDGKFVFCDNEKDLLEKINTLYESRNWKKMVCAEEHILKLFTQNESNIAEPADDNPESADACITGCEMLVARTGSVILSSKQHMGRTSSVFYPVHIIVARTGQVVHDISNAIDGLKKKYGNELPSMMNLNTGPSRTADIEKTLVVGVHGPGEVFCFYINA